MAEGTGPVRVEDFRLHCMRIIWLLKEARDWGIDFVLSPTRFFPADFKRNKTRLDQIHNKLRQKGDLPLT